jgi:hypothetical protein
MNRVYADHFCGCELLFMPNGTQRVGRHLCGSRFVKTFISAGNQLVRNVMSLARPFCQCRTAEELGIVRVREDNENVLRGFPVVHSEGKFRLGVKYYDLRFLLFPQVHPPPS